MGFQTVGLLYGKDFAETICIAVNCGYDTDCTGATVGSILGIIHGNKGLPAKWTQPLGESIATNESWGGLRNCDAGPNPIPRNLADLTKRTIAQAIRFSAGHTPKREDCWADESIRAMWKRSITSVTFPTGTFHVTADYRDTPAVIAGSEKRLTTVVRNTSPDALPVAATLNVPEGWERVSPQSVTVPGLGESTLDWTVRIPGPSRLANSNLLSLRLTSPQRLAQTETPIVLIGARRYRISKPYALPAGAKDSLLDHAFEPETIRGEDARKANARAGLETVHHALGHDLTLAPLLPAGHAIYVQAFLHTPIERNIILGLPTTHQVKSWVNGQVIHNLPEQERFRPAGHKTKAYLDIKLKPGVNEVLVKFVRPAGTGAFDAHFILTEAPRMAGVIDVTWTRLAWE